MRFVLVPGSDRRARRTSPPSPTTSSRFGGAERVEVLPFHQMGRDKWAELGLEYQLEETAPPTPESVEEIRATFRSRGLTVY